MQCLIYLAWYLWPLNSIIFLYMYVGLEQRRSKQCISASLHWTGPMSMLVCPNSQLRSRERERERFQGNKHGRGRARAKVPLRCADVRVRAGERGVDEREG
jgi:hypothetical protein